MRDKPIYEREVTYKLVEVTHTVRILLNSTKETIIKALEQVPDNASVHLINGDDASGDRYGEIVFKEELSIE